MSLNSGVCLWLFVIIKEIKNAVDVNTSKAYLGTNKMTGKKIIK